MINVNLNGKDDTITEAELRKRCLKHFKSGKSLHVYWGGTSEDARMREDGSIEGTGRIGGREFAEKGHYPDFDNWFKESALLGNKRIRIDFWGEE